MKKNITKKEMLFFLILIGIFLLGAVTVLVTRTNTTTDETGSTEQASITASKIIDRAAQVENAINILQSRGCSENEISAWYDSNNDGTEDASDTDVYNATALAERACHLYDVKGAGLTRTGSLSYAAIQDIGTSANDLYFVTKEAIPGTAGTNGLGKALCARINQILKNSLDIENLPVLSGVSANLYSGSMTGSVTYGDDIGENDMAGMKAACVLEGTDYVFYRVVLTR